MRKKLSPILILVMVVILAASLFACNGHAQTIDPNPIAPSTGDDNIESQTASYKLLFSMPYANSVFQAVYIDEFRLSEVSCSLVYVAADGSELTSKLLGPVTEDMIDPDDLGLLTTPGKHTIRASVKVDDDVTVTGKFQLRLKAKSNAAEPVQFRFRIDSGVTAYFGRTTVDGGITYAVAEVEKGSVIESWAEFLSIFKFGKKQSALTSVTYGGGRSTLSATAGFPFAATSNQDFVLNWTRDVVNVRFNLNLPSTAKPIDPDNDPTSMFQEGGEWYERSVQRNIGAVDKPETQTFNLYAGLYFSGWYLPKYDEDGKPQTDDNGEVELDRMWDFSKTVGGTDIELYAKWVEHSYAYTVYPMGGRFKADIAPAKKGQDEITLENYRRLGYTLLESDTRFTNLGALMSISFDGFAFGGSYDKYVANVQLSQDSDERVMLLFSDIYAESNRIFEKDDSCLAFGGLYSQSTCEASYKYAHGGAATVEGDRVGYIGWQLKSGEQALEAHLNNVLFNMSVKADGSVRVDSTKDNSVNVIKIPATIDLGDDVARPVTEIGAHACSNLKSLYEVDLSEAVNLTTIGENAFAFDSNLVSFIQPDSNVNRISTVGKNAFESTEYEEYFTSISGLDFIIINKVIYKYTGDPSDTDGIVDLTVDSYYTLNDFRDIPGVQQADVDRANKQLRDSTRIMGGAFEGATALEVLRLDGVFTTIESGAFSGLTSLRKLTVPEDNALTYVSESAFDGCETFLSAESGNYVPSAEAICIGNIYYRRLNISDANVTVPANYSMQVGSADVEYAIEVIAPHAFYAIPAIQDITFENESAIERVGADAFLGTAYATKQEYLVINGILAEYYGSGVRNATIPADVTVIAEDAFGDNALYLETIEIPVGVKSIEAYAFRGADRLEAIILKSFGADESNTKFEGAPSIQAGTFANKDDALSVDLKLYVSPSAMSLFEKYATADVSSVTDDATRQWVELYQLNVESFSVDSISSVTARADRVAAAYMDGSVDDITPDKAKALFAAYYGEHAEALSDALVVRRTTGVPDSYEALDPSLVSFREVTVWNGQTLDENGKHFVMQYDYPQYPDAFPSEDGQAGAFVISIYKKYAGNYSFSQNGSVTANFSALNKDVTPIYFENLSGDVRGATIPTFYTTTDEEDLSDATFVYEDVAGIEHRLPVNVLEIEDFVLNRETQRTRAYIDVDFYGLGTLRFSYTYAVRRAKYVRIEQREPISIPLNADADEILRRSRLHLIGEDGFATPYYVTAQNFSISLGGVGGAISGVPSDELGQHVFNVDFLDTSDCVQPLKLEVVYTVVLEANPTDFRYEIIDNRPFMDGDVSYAGRASITGYTNRNAITVIIPETCTIGGKLYKVTQIGSISSSGTAALTGVFSGFAQLQTVYLSSNITHIGVRTFEGSGLLKNLRTAVASATDIAAITKEDIAEIDYIPDTIETRGGSQVLVKHVTLTRIHNVTYTEIGADNYGLAIGYEYSFDETDDAGREIVYRISKLNDTLELPTALDDSRNVYLYIPDTVCNRAEFTSEGKPISGDARFNVIFYKSGNARFVVRDAVSDALSYIGNNAFLDCAALQFGPNTFAGASSLEELGAGAFSGTGLTEIDLSQTKLTEVNSNLFEKCYTLRSVKMRDDVTQILQSAFSGCVMLSDLGGLEDNDKLEVIANNAFANCRSLTSFTLHESVSIIEESAFLNCSALTIKCKIAADKTPAGWQTYWNNYGCPVIYGDGDADSAGNVYVLENGVRYMIAAGAEVATVISQSFDLRDAVIAEHISHGDKSYDVTSIAAEAFMDCVRLLSVTVSDKLTTIGANAFANCSALSVFKFGENGDGENGLVSIGQGAFDGCTSLAVTPAVPSAFEKGNFSYSIDRNANTATVNGFAGGVTLDEITIDATVTYAGIEYRIVAIGDGAFRGNSVTALTLGSNVESIGANAFNGCESLATVTAAPALKHIGQSAFQGCVALSSFTGYEALESIGDMAFDGCDALEPKPSVAA